MMNLYENDCLSLTLTILANYSGVITGHAHIQVTPGMHLRAGHPLL